MTDYDKPPMLRVPVKFTDTQREQIAQIPPFEPRGTRTITADLRYALAAENDDVSIECIYRTRQDLRDALRDLLALLEAT